MNSLGQKGTNVATKNTMLKAQTIKSNLSQFTFSALFAATLFLASAAVSNSAVFADQYGDSRPSTSIMVDKMVAVPHVTKGSATTYTYVDNLSTNSYRYAPDAYVFFKIVVKNTSTVTLNDVVVTDQGPQYVQMLENPGKVSGNSLTISVGSLKASESKEYVVKGRVMSHTNLPADKALICVTNRAVATSNGGGSGSVSDSDAAQFCIEKSVSTSKGGVPTHVPQAGPEHAMALYAAAGALSYLGLKLKRAK